MNPAAPDRAASCTIGAFIGDSFIGVSAAASHISFRFIGRIADAKKSFTLAKTVAP